MRTFELVKCFCQRTGKELEPRAVPTSKYICDYSGEIFDIEEFYDLKPAYTVKVDYCHDSEPAWEEDDIDELLEVLGEKYEDKWFEIKAHLFEGEFHFLYDHMYQADNTLKLMQEWMANTMTQDSIFFGVASLGEALRVARLRVVTRLLKEKKVTPKELGLEDL